MLTIFGNKVTYIWQVFVIHEHLLIASQTKNAFVWVTYTLVLNIQFASYIDIMFLIGSPETDVLYFINHNIIKQESKESRDN